MQKGLLYSEEYNNNQTSKTIYECVEETRLTLQK